MALTAAQLARLHRRIDELAAETPDVLEKLLAFLESFDDDETPPDDAGEPTPLTPLTPAGCAA